MGQNKKGGCLSLLITETDLCMERGEHLCICVGGQIFIWVSFVLLFWICL